MVLFHKALLFGAGLGVFHACGGTTFIVKRACKAFLRIMCGRSSYLPPLDPRDAKNEDLIRMFDPVVERYERGEDEARWAREAQSEPTVYRGL